jgi:hypothetical protein
MDETSLTYLRVAQDYLADNQPLVPRPGNGLEKAWFTLDGDKVQPTWEHAKELYEQFKSKDDSMGLLTARRRLAFIYQRANELEIDLA